MVNDASGYLSLPVGILQFGGEGSSLLSRKARIWLYYLSRTHTPCLVSLEELGLILGIESPGAIRKLRSELVSERKLQKTYIGGKGWGYEASCRRMDGKGWEALLSEQEPVEEKKKVQIDACWPAVFLPTPQHLNVHLSVDDLTLNEWWGALGNLIGHRSFSWIMDLQKPKTQEFWMKEIRASLLKRDAPSHRHVRKLTGDPDTQVQTVLLGLARHIVSKGETWCPRSPVAYMRGMIPLLGAPRENLPLPDEEDVEDDMMVLHEQGLHTLVALSQKGCHESGSGTHDFC